MVAIVVGLFVHLLAVCIVVQVPMKSDWKAVTLASKWKLEENLFPFSKGKYRGMKCLARGPH